MTSKSSFWIDIRENTKRRLWTYLASGLLMLFVMPGSLLLTMVKNQRMIEEAIRNGYTEDIYYFQMHLKQQYAENICGITPALAVVPIAVLLGIQGFSYLYAQNKMDMYMSVPVSAKRRFGKILAGSCIVFELLYALNLILCWGLGLMFHVLTPGVFGGSLAAMAMMSLLFAASFGLTAVAAMMTGNVLTAILGTGVLFFYEPVCRTIMVMMKSRFFAAYSSLSREMDTSAFYFTPWANVMLFFSRKQNEAGARGLVGTQLITLADYGLEIVYLLLAAVLTCGAAYFLYRRRKTEGYNEGLVFSVSRPILEVLILCPAVVVCSEFVAEYLNEYTCWALFIPAMIAAVLGHVVIRVIYDKDLKAVSRGIPEGLLGLALGLLILCIFRFDLCGYDSYRPKAEDIVSISANVEYDYQNFGYAALDETKAYVEDSRRVLEEMKSEDPEVAKAILSMVEKWQNAGCPAQNGLPILMNVMNGAVDEAKRVASYEGGSPWIVKYNLKNGKSVYRRFIVSEQKCREELTVVTADVDYKNSRYQILGEDFRDNLENFRLEFRNGVETIPFEMDRQKLLEAYRKDFATYDYSLLCRELPVAAIRFSLTREPGEGHPYLTINQWNYPVYGSFENTLAVLRDAGMEVGEEHCGIKAKDIAAMNFSFYYDPKGENADAAVDEAVYSEGRDVQFVVSDPAEIEKIVKCMYPGELEDVLDNNLHGRRWTYDLNVNYSFAPESGLYYYYSLFKHPEEGGAYLKQLMDQAVKEANAAQ